MFGIQHDVSLTAYTPLAKGRVGTDETLITIGGERVRQDRYTGSDAALGLTEIQGESPVL